MSGFVWPPPSTNQNKGDKEIGHEAESEEQASPSKSGSLRRKGSESSSKKKEKSSKSSLKKTVKVSFVCVKDGVV